MDDTVPMHDDRYRRDLGDGLVLRWSTPDDEAQVASLYAQVFRPRADAPPNWHLPHWVAAMFSGRHPHIGPHDFAVVEDTTTGALVASVCLLRYTFTYDGIAIPFGRPEVVATLPEYRNRGLIRAIFSLIHAKSEARGDLVQGITGIAYYYRQYGYEYAVPMGTGTIVYFPAIPDLKQDASEPYRLRKATAEDIPLLLPLWDREQAGAAIQTPMTAEYMRWAMQDIPKAVERWEPYLILDTSDRPVGFLRLQPARWGAEVNVDNVVVEEGVPLASVVPSILRGVRALAEVTTPLRPETPPAGALKFHLWNTADPFPGVVADLVRVITVYPFAAYPDPWYIRVPDVPAFLKHVAPALERRLASSAQAGYTGELTLDFYRGGLRLAFDGGKLVTAEPWQRQPFTEASAGFPPLVFLQLLFGYRTLDELRSIYPDVWAEGEAMPVLDALFPKLATSLVALD